MFKIQSHVHLVWTLYNTCPFIWKIKLLEKQYMNFEENFKMQTIKY